MIPMRFHVPEGCIGITIACSRIWVNIANVSFLMPAGDAQLAQHAAGSFDIAISSGPTSDRGGDPRKVVAPIWGFKELLRGSKFDLSLIEAITTAVSIPVIASGGMGDIAHLVDAAGSGTPSAIAMAHVLHHGLATLPQIRAAAIAAGLGVRWV